MERYNHLLGTIRHVLYLDRLDGRVYGQGRQQAATGSSPVEALEHLIRFHTDFALREFQDKVAGQDTPIVESQRPELLPLDLQTELHLKSDRTAIAYRQWLKKIGLKYGTA